MQQLIIQHAAIIRLGFFFGILIVMALWELISPRRELQQGKTLRWFSNIGIATLNTVVVRLLFASAAVGVAMAAAKNGWGILNYFQFNYPVRFIASVIILDFAIYIQHVMEITIAENVPL